MQRGIEMKEETDMQIVFWGWVLIVAIFFLANALKDLGIT